MPTASIYWIVVSNGTMLGVLQNIGSVAKKWKLWSIYICYQRGWINYFISLPSSDYFSDYLRQRKNLAGDGVLQLCSHQRQLTPVVGIKSCLKRRRFPWKQSLHGRVRFSILETFLNRKKNIFFTNHDLFCKICFHCKFFLKKLSNLGKISKLFGW